MVNYMFIPKTIEHTSNSIMYAMPNGKPNLKQKVLEEKIPEIILQKKQKGNTCAYYAYNYIRKRIGDNISENSSTQLKKERKIEKICSLYRKEQTKIGNIFDILNPLVEVLDNKNESISLLKVHSIINHLLTKEEAEEAKGILETCLKDNKTGSKSLKNMIEEKEISTSLEASLTFYKNLNVDYKKRLAIILSKQLNKLHLNDDIDELNVALKRNIAHIDSLLLMAEQYGLKESKWCPGKIEGLIQELKDHGPLKVSGKHGRCYYSETPFKLSEKNGDYETYGFKPGATRKTINASHAVLLVGAKIINNKSYVYIKEPNDENDPMKKETNKIYKISYEKFCEHLTDVFGNTKGSWSSKFGFAHYANFTPS